MLIMMTITNFTFLFSESSLIKNKKKTKNKTESVSVVVVELRSFFLSWFNFLSNATNIGIDSCLYFSSEYSTD